MIFGYYKYLGASDVRRVMLDEDDKVRYTMPWGNPWLNVAGAEMILPDTGVAMRKVTRPFRHP